jgi:hypothetical protein
VVFGPVDSAAHCRHSGPLHRSGGCLRGTGALMDSALGTTSHEPSGPAIGSTPARVRLGGLGMKMARSCRSRTRASSPAGCRRRSLPLSITRVWPACFYRHAHGDGTQRGRRSRSPSSRPSAGMGVRSDAITAGTTRAASKPASADCPPRSMRTHTIAPRPTITGNGDSGQAGEAHLGVVAGPAWLRAGLVWARSGNSTRPDSMVGGRRLLRCARPRRPVEHCWRSEAMTHACVTQLGNYAVGHLGGTYVDVRTGPSARTGS